MKQLKKLLNAIIISCITIPCFSQNISSSNSAEQQEREDSTSISRELDEVVVTAAKVKVYPDHDEMIPSAENKKFGANALDAVSSLPLFITRISADQLLDLQGKPVTIIINGKPSTYEQLQRYQGVDIKKVNYYTYAPAKYAALTTGPVAEIIIQKPREAFYRLQANSTTGAQIWETGDFSFGFNRDKVAFTYMDSLNLFMADYDYSFTDYDKKPGTIEYVNGSKTTRYTDNRGWSRANTHAVNASYQYSTDQDLFSIAAFYKNTPSSKGATETKAEMLFGDDVFSGTRNTEFHFNEESVGGGLFYDHTFSPSSQLQLDMQASYVNSDYCNSLIIDIPGIPNFENRNNSRNKVINGSFFGVYTQNIGSGALTADIYNTFSRITQTTNEQLMPVGTSWNPSLFLSYSYNFPKVSLRVTAGYHYYYNKIRHGASNVRNIPTGGITVGYKISNCISLRGSASIGSSYMSLGSRFDETKYYLDDNFYKENNFFLKPVTNTYYSLSFSYTSPDYKLSAGYGPSVTYNTNPFYTFIIKEGDEYMQKTINADRYLQVSNSVYCSYRPWKWLDFYGSVGWHYYENALAPLPMKTMKGHNFLSARLMVNLRYKGLIANFMGDTGSARYEGNKKTTTPFNMMASVAWRKNDLYLSLDWQYNWTNQTTEIQSEGFRWYSNIPSQGKNYFYIRVQYTFNHGIIKKQKFAKQATISTDNGLM